MKICGGNLRAGGRLIVSKLRRSYLLSTCSMNFSTEGTKQDGSDVIYDVVISGGGMVGTAMAAALGMLPAIFTDVH